MSDPTEPNEITGRTQSERPDKSGPPFSRDEWATRHPARPRRAKRLGVLPIKAVRTAAFGIISLSIFACGGLCLLAVWDATAAGVPWRALTSLGIVAATMGAFAFVNELFGEAEKNDASVMGGAA